jgi:beta-phosphoglucomutase family hydrolase
VPEVPVLGKERGVLGLPDDVTACLFDLDGVLTDTASVHDKAWKQVFDGLLAERGLPAFDPVEDYARYVDGKRREDGVRDFLASRGITLPEGGADDPPGTGTVSAVGNAKNALLLKTIEQDGVEVYEGSRRYLQAARDAGLRRAVVSSSANTASVLQVTGLDALVELRVDGVVAADRGLKGKPAPDTFLAAAQELGLEPRQCAVFEDAEAGVQAGRDGGFGHVVGVDRTGHADALREHGATVVVRDLAELLA